MPFSLNETEAILANVGILRGKSYKPFLGEADGKLVVKRRVNPWIANVRRTSFQTMLAHHHRPALADLNILGNEEYSVGKDMGRPHVQYHFVASEFGLV